MASRPASHLLRTARDRGDARARDLDETDRPHQLDELVDLVRTAGQLEDEALCRRIDDAGAESFGKTQRLDTVVAFATANSYLPPTSTRTS